MADYDVGVLSLQVPPPSAVIQPYRPAVLVKNNGVHDALAVGSLRIYSPAGLLIFTTALYSGVILPGATQPAQADNNWTPPALGRYMFIATVSCLRDQYEPNDNLAPTFVNVIPGEPTPPTPVTMHAAQHEEGGGDEIIIDGLHGRAADAQTPLGHKASHQAAGSDQLDVTGLPGILAQGQPIADHHESHEDGGGDELNVDGLHGKLFNVQKPDVHNNSAHDPNYSADPHGASNHNSSVEATANKGKANGYAGLDADARVHATNLGGDPSGLSEPTGLVYDNTQEPPLVWAKSAPAAHAESHEQGGDDEVTTTVHGTEFHSNDAPSSIRALKDNAEGTSLLVPRADHVHRACAGFGARMTGTANPGPTSLWSGTIPADFLKLNKAHVLHLQLGFLLSLTDVGPVTINATLTPQGESPVDILSVAWPFPDSAHSSECYLDATIVILGGGTGSGKYSWQGLAQDPYTSLPCHFAGIGTTNNWPTSPSASLVITATCTGGGSLSVYTLSLEVVGDQLD